MVTRKQTEKTDGATKNATLKLLKYDLRWIYKILAPLYLALVACAIFARLFGAIENSVVFEIVTQIFVGATIALAINILINTVARSCSRFTRNLYKDESYLTHTLPVSTKAIFRAKVLAALVTVFTTVAVVLASLFIAFYSDALLELVKSTLQLVAEIYNTSVIAILLLVALVSFVEVLLFTLIGFVCIILGHRASNNKPLKSIIWGLVIYAGAQLLMLGALVLYGLVNPEIMNLINTTVAISVDALKSLLYFTSVVYLLDSIALYLLGQKLLARGVNVD
ncbi:MAG: hypothetical protein Q4B34_03020 [Candidatus Saccharibacteria bacterium]|nr:hypothetical protein [Candidatus Saccharibacteria bacterium]